MSHFYGTLKGARGPASRCGTRGSGLEAVAASWQGAVRVYLWHDDATGRDIARVVLAPWHGRGVTRTLYVGPVDQTEEAAAVRALSAP